MHLLFRFARTFSLINIIQPCVSPSYSPLRLTATEQQITDSHQHVALFLLSYLLHNRLTKKKKERKKTEGRSEIRWQQWQKNRNSRHTAHISFFSSFLYFQPSCQGAYMCLQKKKRKIQLQMLPSHTLLCYVYNTDKSLCMCAWGNSPSHQTISANTSQFCLTLPTRPRTSFGQYTAHRKASKGSRVQRRNGAQGVQTDVWQSGRGLQGSAAENVLADTGRSWHIKSCLLEERRRAPTTDVTYELPLRRVRSPWLPQTAQGTLICQAARNKIGPSSSVLAMSVK